MKAMKLTLTALLLTILSCIVIGCKTKSVIQTETIHIHDSIVMYDTVHVIDTLAPKQTSTGMLSLLSSSNDSLLSSNADLQTKLNRLSNLVLNGKLTTDTLRRHTQYADAWACVTDNMLCLGLTQKPIVAQYDKVNKATKVHDRWHNTSNKSKTVVVTKPFFADTWFWTTVVLSVILILVLLWRLGLKRLKSLFM